MFWIHALSILVFLGLGRLFSRNTNQKLITKDLLVNFATGLGIFLLIKPVVTWLSESLDWKLLSLDIGPSWLHFLFAFVLIDGSRYWVHYAHHRVSILWKFHRVHHSSETLDASSGLRMHAVDFIQLGLIPIFWFGLLFDISAWEEWLLPSALSVGIIFDAFQHSSLRFPLQNPVCKAWHRFLNNPHFHAWHHIKDAQLCDGNYGNVLLVWDRIFRTDVTKEALPPEFGITDDQAIVIDPISLQLLRSAQ